jgi:NAD(P)-dependent dehydrogenase (short-subunit alcohol dehydrogenase family)
VPRSSPQAAPAQDPKEAGPKPDFAQPPIPPPGLTDDMRPRPDHGEASYQGLGRLTGKVALLTGADSGIGKAVAIAFAREGADLVISHLPAEEPDGADTERWVRDAGRRAVRAPGDLRDETYCTSLVDRAIAEFGRLDLLVNNAAFQRTCESIDQISTAEFDATFKTNVYAMFWLCRAALPRMEPGASIVNVASIQAYDPSPHLLAYAATKGAIVNFTKGLSALAMKQGVRVNAVAPGPVWTPLIPSTMDEQKTRHFGAQTEFGRPAQPVELAPIFVFLASNEARFVTGEVYGATGGQTPY